MTEWKIKRRSPDHGYAARTRRYQIKQMRQHEELEALLAQLEREHPTEAFAIRVLVDAYLIEVKEARAMAQSLRAQEVVETSLKLELIAPAPEAQLEYPEAWQRSRDDLARCQELIESAPDLATLVKVHLNCVDWQIYWSIHERTPETRELFAVAAEKGAAEMEAIMARVEKLMEGRTEAGDIVAKLMSRDDDR
jgi:hypothetical protein